MNGRIRIRALVTGLLLGLFLCIFTPYNNTVLHNTPLGGGHFPLAPFFIIAWLFVLDALAARLSRRRPFYSGVELLVIWLMTVLFTSIGYAGLSECFFINITAPEHFAQDAYRWTEVLTPLLPKSWFPDSTQAVHVFYEGIRNGRTMGVLEVLSSIPWHVWLPVLAVWALFILGAFFVMICLMVLFGRQWVVNERVLFPLVRVPMLMGEALDQRQFLDWWSNRYLLIGLTFAGALHLLNGLHFYFPSIPQMPTLVLAGTYFPKFGLFSGFHKLKMFFVPAFIGFAFLTTRQISFSMWVFYILGGLLFGVLYIFGWQLPEAALGTTLGPDLARPEGAQTIGAYIIFFIFLLWLARHHLKETVICFLRPVCHSSELEGKGKFDTIPKEWGPPIWPLWGLIGGLVGLSAWCWFFGLPLLAALFLPLMFLIFTLVTSRIVCQGGLPYFTLTAAPSDALMGFFGTGFFGTVGIAATAVMQKVLFLDMREALAPTLFHGSKIRQEARQRHLVLIAIGIALVLALTTAFVTMLFLGYKYGLRELGLDWATQTVLANYQNAQRLVDQPVGPNGWTLTYAGAGAVVMGLLIFCYYKIPWWPLHPLGYLVAYSGGMKILWFPFFLGWLCNHLVLHYGGTALFNRVRFLFVGLILGDFLMGGVFTIVGLFNNQSYSVFPL
ncbi:DUF6785 family protein [Pseudodesulfovibrio piezophilus]|uniref:Uncharacterized protein n=1 Tax=Pseudodesulfovibrio piezophilus (strain DSM 21447 / JCM 15486 / C1TLV30) TaxID=1322246 RepID=M1WKA0_PSEP2|nr:DUF6785 family protein [Pseudodesulfovibrio piezophilus]CCH49236.1 conserved membrane protein of unknown function [Pseudodesulfovibrio piezophilus C1TLV30]